MTKNVYKTKNKVLSIIGMVIANVLLALVITIVFGFATGYKFLNIITGSMTPTMPVGTIVVVKNIDIADVVVGDVITFTQGTSKITHRVVEKTVSENNNIVLKTQGDAAENKGSRETVTKNNFVGVVVCHFKGLGYVFELVKENIIFITIAIVLALFIVTYS